MAAALVAGQAALCAVIGWLTFGPSEPAPRAAAVNPPAAQISAPTLPVLTLPPPLPAPAPAPSNSVAKTVKPPVKSSKPAVTRKPSKPVVDEKPQIVIEPAKSKEPSVSPNPELQATPPPAPVGEVQGPVVKGLPCSPEGAKGETLQDVALRCAKDDDGDLVWQIN